MGEMCADLDVRWARRRAARAVREAILMGVLGPAMDLYSRRRVSGTEHFDGVDAPVILVANHASHMDTPAILRALPKRWRRRTAVAAAADYFYGNRGVANAVSLVFCTVPLQRRGGGLGRGATSQLDQVMDDRWSLLLYAEGTRSRDGTVGRLHSGAASMAAEHGVALLPVFVSGTRDAMPPGRRWMRRRPGRIRSGRHPLEIRFGAPVWPREGEHRTEVMERVRRFFAESGAVTTPNRRLAAAAEAAGAPQPAQAVGSAPGD